MPWLIVQVALPFILLSGKFLGDLVQAICWRRSRFVGWRALLTPLTAAALGLGVWLLYLYLDRGKLNPYTWALLGVVVALCVAALFLGHLARRRWGLALMALGVAALLFGFGVFVAGRVNYSYKDSPVELLVYAQGSVDLRKVSEDVREAVAKAAPGGEIAVDYELWYPYQWYARHDKNVRFICYKDRNEDGWQSYCSPLREAPPSTAVLMITSHANRDQPFLENYDKKGLYWNLLWFPQVYRVPDISSSDSFLTRRRKEVSFLKDHITERAAWRGFWRYELTRKLGSAWWFSDFYAFLPKGGS
jgi:hypothetical protein